MADHKEYNQILYGNSIVWIIVISAIAFENVICLLAISTRKRWKSPDVLLFSLILAHFLTLVLPMLLYSAVSSSKGKWEESACKFLVWCFMSFKIVNSLQISFLSMDRVWTLKWPGSYRVHNTAKQSTRTVSFIWIFGLSIGCIPLLGWPDDPAVAQNCSVILNIGGYGYALCIVVIILGSFVVSSACVTTILLHLALQKLPVEGTPKPEFKQPIPEIVIESETGERTSAVQGSRETQNRQICLLVSAMVVVEFFINGIPFVVINLMALTSNSQQAWMPATVVWSALGVTLINPVLLCIVCQRYRRSYVKLATCLGEACGCADSSVRDTTTGGIQRQETIDSLDNFSDPEDELGKSTSNFGDLSFSIDMDDEQALEYGITASMERDIRSLEQAGILAQESLDFDNEAYIQDEGVKKALSSKERRALWLAQKACRRNSPDTRRQGHAEDATAPKESSQFLSVDRADSLRNHHRKLERNFRPRDPAHGVVSQKIKRSNSEDSGQTVHTVKVDIENGGLNVRRVDGLKGDHAKKSTEMPRYSKKQKSADQKDTNEGREKQLRNGGLIGSKSCDTAISTGTRKTKKKRRSSVPQEKENNAYNVKLSPIKGQGEGHGLSRSNRFDVVRERMLSEMSSLHGSGELYDIPEEEGEEVQETSFTPSLTQPSEDVPEELIPDKPFEQSTPTPNKTARAGKKQKKKSKDKRYSRRSLEKSSSIDVENDPLSKEEEWLKRAIEREEASGPFAFENISSETDTTDGVNSEYSGYITSRNSSVVSKMSTFPSIDASLEYDMDMIVIEQVHLEAAPAVVENDQEDEQTANSARKVANIAGDEIARDPESLDSIGVTVQGGIAQADDAARVPTTSVEPGQSLQSILPDFDDSIKRKNDKDAVSFIKTALTNLPSGESDPWANQSGRPRANSAGAGRTSTAKDMREKYRRSRSERIILEPITNSDSSQEILYL
ncbi:LOW QUALITY PROTEIN: uncharacterized protein LOC110976505 [Acanthaster planci]|uniref:LOW QUALITY PROTEIN: uncharacterized protein LOC110976505 n=1 Tax=Acanthaster planci TaxID=133434 RepID=A0A8B7Y0M6_ACAPL|nr:LOW QUALITY PROTEIN: uncharacterized protein LOC110976505 [Acanthaster planci]